MCLHEDDGPYLSKLAYSACVFLFTYYILIKSTENGMNIFQSVKVPGCFNFFKMLFWFCRNLACISEPNGSPWKAFMNWKGEVFPIMSATIHFQPSLNKPSNMETLEVCFPGK